MKILFFSQAAELAGCREVQWESAQPVSVDEFWRRLLLHYPELADLRSQCRLAVDQVYIGRHAMIDGCAEVAIIPPVSGG